MKYITKVESCYHEVIESVSLFFSQDLQNEGNLPLEEVSVDDILEAQRQEQQKKQDEQKTQNKKLLERGLQPHAEGTADDFT